jgi:anti-sigma factor RsiW
VRCSSCEPLLDRYIEGTLKPAQMRAISEHVEECEHCRGLLEEVKMIDGLLATTRIPHLPENFTFAVMAEVGSMPAPRARQHPVWSFLVLYSAAVWAAAVAGMVLTGTGPATIIAAIGSALGKAGIASAAFSSTLSQSLTQAMPGLAAFGFGVLIIDIAIACAFALIYFVVRPRLAARLAPVPVSEAS